MPLSGSQILRVREWVGSEELVTDEFLSNLYDELKSYDAVILSVLRTRLANFLAEPSSLTVPGLSVSNTTNIPELRTMITKIESEGTGLDEGSGGAIGVSTLVRDRLR